MIIVYQEGQQINNVTNYINLADYILGNLNDTNQSQGGILYVDTIADASTTGIYSDEASVVEVNNYLGTYIVLIQEQGNELFQICNFYIING